MNCPMGISRRLAIYASGGVKQLVLFLFSLLYFPWKGGQVCHDKTRGLDSHTRRLSSPAAKAHHDKNSTCQIYPCTKISLALPSCTSILSLPLLSLLQPCPKMVSAATIHQPTKKRKGSFA
ncbi:hypothetical protein V8C35DRAFT_228242 [Trichoderma chlorosporum]